MALMDRKRHRGKKYEERQVSRRGAFKNRGRKYEERRVVRRGTFKKKRRRRTGLYVFLALIILTVGALIFYGTDLTSLRMGGDSVGRVADPTVEGAPEVPSDADEESADDGSSSDEDSSTDEDEEAPVPPDDPTMFLSVPKLGISGATIVGGEGGLELGGQLVSGAPWVPHSNTYIAGHRLGFPGTGSDHIFYNLPNLSPGDEVTLTDTLGQVYEYRVSEILEVDPTDVWVADPVPGRDVVSLQTCIENFGDHWTEGPDWNARYIVRADRV